MRGSVLLPRGHGVADPRGAALVPVCHPPSQVSPVVAVEHLRRSPQGRKTEAKLMLLIMMLWSKCLTSILRLPILHSGGHSEIPIPIGSRKEPIPVVTGNSRLTLRLLFGMTSTTLQII